MDYPHPYIGLENGAVDITNAYDTGIGEWDKVAVAYSYSDFPEGTDSHRALQEILTRAQADGLRYISDQDARAMGGAHAYAHLWDGGAEAAPELDRMLEVRKAAISQFSPANIRTGEPFSVLEDVFVPLYFFHRYQTEAVSKVIGGLDYSYAVRGDGARPWQAVPRDAQETALKSILQTLDARHLAIPPSVLQWFPPRAMGYPATRESFKGRTGVAFDALGAAETAADMTLGLLLHPERASRLVQQRGFDPGQVGLEEVIARVVEATVFSKPLGSYEQQVQEVVNFQVLRHLMRLALEPDAHPQVSAVTHAAILDLKSRLLKAGDSAVAREMVRRIDRFLEHPEEFKPEKAPQIPDGSPIGMGCLDEIPLTWK